MKREESFGSCWRFLDINGHYITSNIERARKRKLAEQHAAEATQKLIKTELKQKEISNDKILWPDETEVLDLDLIEFGNRRLSEEESSENLEENINEDIEGSGDVELEVKDMEILQRANHATNLEISQTTVAPANEKVNFMKEMREIRNALRNKDR